MTGPLALWGRLLWHCWPQLLLIAALAMIGEDLLMRGAVWAGARNAAAGMIVLSFVVLLQLLAIVLMFAALRPHLPALAALRGSDGAAPDAPTRRAHDRLLGITAAAILPFFAYYAAWGFLGDTVRAYSREALARLQAGERIDVFAFAQTWGVIAAVALCWLVRVLAKRMNSASGHPFWRLLMVAADASWIFIGLYALDVWKDEWISRLGGALLLGLDSLSVVGSAYAQAGQSGLPFVPVEFRPASWGAQAQSLFFYALLPMIWLVMAAIINGYELSPAKSAPPLAAGRSWVRWIVDFVKHFWGGYRSRYAPVWACLKLTLGAGLSTLVTFVIAYRMIGWADAWAWYGATRVIGAHDFQTWQLISDFITPVLGSPSELQGGLLLEPLRVALLAAVLEYAVGSARDPAPASKKLSGEADLPGAEGQMAVAPPSTRRLVPVTRRAPGEAR